MTYLVYETQGKSDILETVEAKSNRDALVAFLLAARVPEINGYITQVKAGSRYILHTTGGLQFIADKV